MHLRSYEWNLEIVTLINLFLRHHNQANIDTAYAKSSRTALYGKLKQLPNNGVPNICYLAQLLSCRPHGRRLRIYTPWQESRLIMKIARFATKIWLISTRTCKTMTFSSQRYPCRGLDGYLQIFPDL